MRKGGGLGLGLIFSGRVFLLGGGRVRVGVDFLCEGVLGWGVLGWEGQG